MKEYWVYELRAGDWLYIGQSSNPKQRLANHRSTIRCGQKAKHWDEALIEYPDPHQWSMEVVAGPYDTEEEAMIEEARRQDEHWEIPGRLWRNKGTKMGPEVLDRHRERMQGEDNPNRGKVLSDEHKEKLREAMAGENSYWYGKTRSRETREKISASLSGQTSNFKGKTHSVVSKQIMSAAAMGRPSSFKGKTHSPEARAKMKTTRAAKRYVKKFFEWLEHPAQ